MPQVIGNKQKSEKLLKGLESFQRLAKQILRPAKELYEFVDRKCFGLNVFQRVR
jgi:hypothetical protein